MRRFKDVTRLIFDILKIETTLFLIITRKGGFFCVKIQSSCYILVKKQLFSSRLLLNVAVDARNSFGYATLLDRR
jgi:hypothetical protein